MASLINGVSYFCFVGDWIWRNIHGIAVPSVVLDPFKGGWGDCSIGSNNTCCVLSSCVSTLTFKEPFANPHKSLPNPHSHLGNLFPTMEDAMSEVYLIELIISVLG